MVRFFLLTQFFALLLYGDSLASLLTYAQQNNHLLAASKILKTSKEKELSASKLAYYPTLDAGAFYNRDDEPSPFQPGTTYGASLKVGIDIYDGGKKHYTVKQKQDELSAKEFGYRDEKKSLTLSITQNFYTLLSMHSLLKAREEASEAVKSQLQRMQKFLTVKLATQDDVDRLQAAYDKNIYAIESLKLDILSLKKHLELQVGRPVGSLEHSRFQKTSLQSYEPLDSITVLEYSKKALLNASETVDSYYYPNIRLEDTYTLYGYQDKPNFGPIPIEYLSKQNKLQATLNLRLIDFGVISQQKEVLTLKAQALNEQILYKSQEQQMQLQIAKERIYTAKLNIKSAKSGLRAAKSALVTITKKYQAGIVDNVVYLDALATQTEAKALYEKSLNDLELAYAQYYYYNNKNLLEYLK